MFVNSRTEENCMNSRKNDKLSHYFKNHLGKISGKINIFENHLKKTEKYTIIVGN